MTVLFSVIVPSRLARRGDSQELWLERALSSIANQTVLRQFTFEVVVGLDYGKTLPENIAPEDLELRGVAAGQGHTGQASALNAALADARGEFVAILEDDDKWQGRHLEFALAALRRYDFASSAQMEVTEKEEPVRINYFPTPSGWVMPRELYQEIGDFDETYRLHLDNEWLGRLNAKQKRRCHIVESTANVMDDNKSVLPAFLKRLPAGSGVVYNESRVPNVIRTVNSKGGMASTRVEGEAKKQSDEEVWRLVDKYGFLPW